MSLGPSLTAATVRSGCSSAPDLNVTVLRGMRMSCARAP